MSFILDALRKSETDRQRQTMPGLVDAGYRPPAARRAIWIPVLVVVLAANLALLAAFWWRGRAGPAPPPAAVPAATPQAARTSTARRPVAPGNTLSAVAGISPAGDDLPVGEQDPAFSGGEGYTEIFEPPLGPGGVGSPEIAGGPAAAAPAAGSRIRSAELPTVGELAANGTLALPALHLDIHVFSTTPAERFAFINMKKYTEGAALAEGPLVEEITGEGVVLSHNGQRFLLTRE